MNKFEKHEEICKELTQLYKDKNSDYGDSFGETFNKLGVISAVTRISDKTNRIQNIAVKKTHTIGESIRDSLIDLDNYAILTIIELEGNEDR